MTLEGAIRAAAKRGELIRDPQATLDELVQLRAEVRALRKDRERLDFAIKLGLVRVWHGEPGQRYSREANRGDLDAAMIDAALPARGGEDGA